MNQATITDQSKALFIEYANDAGNWSGCPMVGGNVADTKQNAGNLTQLKKAGLISTFKDDGITWMNFTAEGVAYAADLGIDVRP